MKYTDPSGHCAADDQECLDAVSQIQDLFNITIEDWYNSLWTVTTLEWLKKGLQAFENAIGARAYQAYFPKDLVRLNTSGGGGKWFADTNRVLIGEDYFESETRLKGHIVHEMTHGLLIRSGTEKYANDLFAKLTDWSKRKETHQECFLIIFCQEVTENVWANPQDGPTPYARGEGMMRSVPGEDAADTFAALIVQGFGDRPVTEGRQSWYRQIIGVIQPDGPRGGR